MSIAKILISYKKRHKVLKSEILTPIQTGRAVAEDVFGEMIGDDTGDNISSLNPYYAELSAQYWAWKNYSSLGSPDYIGFMHYRRHFIFNEGYVVDKPDVRALYGYSAVAFDRIDDEYIRKVGLSDAQIEKSLQGADLILVKRANCNFLDCNTPKDDFVKNTGSKGEDYDRFIGLVADMYPTYSAAIEYLNKGPFRYFYNMFVMRKELFDRYSEELFAVLEKFFDGMNMLAYSEKSARVCGYMGEFFLSLFAFRLYEENKYRIKEVYSSIIVHPSYDDVLSPHWQDNQNAIACSCSNLFAPYLGVYLQSICEHSVARKKYDIIVFESNISAENKIRLMKVVDGYQNVSLRFYDVQALFAGIDLPIAQAAFARQCYYRLAMGKVFKSFNRVCFTDIDIIVKFDISEIFELDIKDNPLAACEEILWSHENRIGRMQQGKDVSDYICHEVQCSDKYYNTGVLLVDVKKFNEVANFEKLVQIGVENNFINQEQCVLNKVFDGKIYTLPPIYNFEIFSQIFQSDKLSMVNYMKSVEHACIYHYLTTFKAWFYPELPKADLWWTLARKTPFYEEISRRMYLYHSKQQKISDGTPQLRNELTKTHFPNINNHFAANEKQMQLMFVIEHMWAFRVKQLRYQIQKAFSFGKRYEKYNAKYKAVRELLRDARVMKKNLFSI